MEVSEFNNREFDRRENEAAMIKLQCNQPVIEPAALVTIIIDGAASAWSL
jgi:hypothetical protein